MHDDCAKTFSPPTICSPTTRRSRCSIRAVDEQRLVGCGSMPAGSGRGTGRAASGGISVRAGPESGATGGASRTVQGVLNVDGYAGFERLIGSGDVVLAACWAHTRRKFYEVAEATGSPVAAEALRRIGEPLCHRRVAPPIKRKTVPPSRMSTKECMGRIRAVERERTNPSSPYGVGSPGWSR